MYLWKTLHKRGHRPDLGQNADSPDRNLARVQGIVYLNGSPPRRQRTFGPATIDFGNERSSTFRGGY
jgi:hypothetical protein